MPNLAVPGKFRNYDILERLPMGGSGYVYKARHYDGSIVAIKFFDHDVKREQTRFHYFVNENTLLRAITEHRQHPYIVRQVEHNFIREPYYVVSRYIDYAHQMIDLVGKPMLPGCVLRVVEQLSNALDYVHYAHPDYSPIIHRDVNPNNILIATTGDAILIDFGSAMHAQFVFKEEKGLGTIPYMPPEQYEGTEVPATDQFALAAVALYMLTGKKILPDNPHSAQKKLKQLQANGNKDIATMLGDQRKHTATVMSKAMAYVPDDRYSSCEAFAYQLRRAMQDDGLDISTCSFPTKKNTEWMGWVLMGMIIVGALIMLILVMMGVL